MSKKRTILIGIDGCCWDYINPLLEKRKLPNIEHLMENGTSSILDSTIPAVSPVAWSTFITGKNPDTHGIFDWIKYDENSGKIRRVSPRERAGVPFWHYLNKAGVRVGVSNLPMTFPAEKLDGFLVSGFDSPDDNHKRFYPRELNEKIKTFYGWDMGMIPFSAIRSDEDRLKYMLFYEEYCDRQTDVSLKLIEDYDVDVFVVNYMIIDHFNHIIKDYSMIDKGLQIVDRNIGKYLDKYANSNFIVFSDHGSTRVDGALAIVEWLKDHGYIEIDIKRLEFVKLNEIIHNIFKEKLKLTDMKEKLLRRSLVAPLSLLPTSILSSINHHLLNGKEEIRYWQQDAIDSNKSKIIYCSLGSTGIYLNRKNNAAKTEKLIERLIHDLLDIRDPVCGKPIIDRVYKKEELYRDTTYWDHAPDLMLSLCGPYFVWISDVIQNREVTNKTYFYSNDEINYFGRHTNEGIFVCYGEDLNNMSNIKELNIVDIPAILLYLNGVAIPRDFDGIVKQELFSKNFLKFNDIKYQTEQELTDNDHKKELNIDSEDQEEIQKKLSDLGYM